MKNKEKYHDEIFDIACKVHTFCVVKGKVSDCNITPCQLCVFSESQSCKDSRAKWLEQEYKEPAPKLTKREQAFVEAITGDFSLIRENDGTLGLLIHGSVLELDGEMFKFVKKCTDKKDLLALEVEE